MKSKEVYVDEVTGKAYDDKNKALQAENSHKDIQQAFSFWKDEDIDSDWCIQMTDEFYNKVIDTFEKMLMKHEKWIYDNCVKDGGWKNEYILGYYVSRCLDDSQAFLNNYRFRIHCTCPTCHKAYQQPYYAIKCKHDNTVPVRKTLSL